MSSSACRGGTALLWTIIAILLVLWLMGWILHIAGAHLLLLLLALVVLLWKLAAARKTT